MDTLGLQVEMAKELDVDFPAFHPITPVPGTRSMMMPFETATSPKKILTILTG